MEDGIADNGSSNTPQKLVGTNRSQITKIGRLAIVNPVNFYSGFAIPPIEGGGWPQPEGAKIDASFYGPTVSDNCVLGSFRAENGDLIEVCYVGTLVPNHIAAAINGELVISGTAAIFNGTFTYICEE